MYVRNETNLYTELPGRNEYEDPGDCQLLGSVEQPLQHRQHVRRRLTGSRRGAATYIPAQQRHRYSGRLDGGRVDEPHLLDRFQQWPRQVHGGEGRFLVICGGVFEKFIVVVGCFLHLYVYAGVSLSRVLLGSLLFPLCIPLFHLKGHDLSTPSYALLLTSLRVTL